MVRAALVVVVVAGCGRFDFAPYGPLVDGGDGDGAADVATIRSPAMGRIAAGTGFTCMARVDGSVWCWGLADDRQLGNNSLVSQSVPTRAATLSGIEQVAAGFGIACAIDGTGAVWCWGDNGNGGHGAGTTTFMPLPEQALLARPATSIALGGSHACAVLDDATVWCWGANYEGECGADPIANPIEATPIQVLDHVVQVTSGDNHTCVRRDDDSVWCWGSNAFGELGDNTGDHYQPHVVAGLTAIGLGAGTDHECALLAGGRFSCWGSNGNGQLGVPGDGMSSLPTPATASSTTGWIALEGGDRHTCALTATGSVGCWGGDADGELGNGMIYDSVDPGAPLLSGTIVGVAASDSHTCALRDDDSVACWGVGSHGELGGGTHAQRIPQQVALAGAATAIAAHQNYACVLIGGAVTCWGYDGGGQLGDLGSAPDYVESTPTAVSGVSSATAIAAGGQHVCATSATGLTCWGEDNAGQLGDGTDMTFSMLPTAAVGVGTPIGAVGLGDAFSCAVGGGTLRCWGDDEEGEVGDGNSGSDVLVPKAVAGLSNVTAMSGSLYNGCAIGAASHVSCWGRNMEGEVGSGMTGQMVVAATATSGGHAYNAISTGYDHSCAVRTTGSVDCWGDNNSGDIGDGTYSARAVPTATTIAAGATAIAAGADFSCAIVSGAVSCWGHNDLGQLGDGSTDAETTAMQITVGTVAVVAISAGDEFACALGNDGKVWCWGDNAQGQMGNGTTSRAIVPVEASP